MKLAQRKAMEKIAEKMHEKFDVIRVPRYLLSLRKSLLSYQSLRIDEATKAVVKLYEKKFSLRRIVTCDSYFQSDQSSNLQLNKVYFDLLSFNIIFDCCGGREVGFGKEND